MKRDLGTALIGGGVGGLLDALYATVLWGFILGDNPAGLWQSVAAGLLGKTSYEGGHATALLGLALHFFIAFVMALVYVRAARKLPVLVQRPILMGVLYGFALYLVMNFVVVPLLGPRLSRAEPRGRDPRADPARPVRRPGHRTDRG